MPASRGGNFVFRGGRGRGGGFRRRRRRRCGALGGAGFGRGRLAGGEVGGFAIAAAGFLELFFGLGDRPISLVAWKIFVDRSLAALQDLHFVCRVLCHGTSIDPFVPARALEMNFPRPPSGPEIFYD